MTSVLPSQEQDDSGEYSDGSQEENNIVSVNDGDQPESDYDSRSSDSENSNGEEESQEADRRVDDDEDRSNPQYIPKRGTFYEHDDRTAASGEESVNTTTETASEKKEGTEAPPERRRAPRKSDIIDKWSHDKYNENEQIPKSRDELVSIYGYDIRNEDAPPHARRNRRYGRGPNKYTRTWEDEEAYKRQAAAVQGNRKPPNPEDFPELDTSGKKFTKRGRQRPRSKSQPAVNDSTDSNPELRRNTSIKTSKGGNKQNANKTLPKTQVKDKLPPLENLTITTIVNNGQGQVQRKVNTSVAQQRPVPTEHAKRKPNAIAHAQQQPQPTNNKTNAQQQQQQQPVSQQQQQHKQNQQQLQQQNNTGGEQRGGSKRYSSLRQRPLAETYSPQQTQTQNQQPHTQPQPTQPQPTQQRYHSNHEFPPGAQTNTQPQASPAAPPPPPPQIHPQQLMHQVRCPPPVTHAPSPPHQNIQQPPINQQVRVSLMEPQQMVHAHHPPPPIHNLPQSHTIGQLQPAQGYAPPAMMPAQFMQPSGGGGHGGHGAVFGGAVYAPPAPQYHPHTHPHQHTHSHTQLYQHHNYPTQTGGVTYYSPAVQEQEPPRATRRPTAAIPIVRPANPLERDNIDRIVENMFVRKPWPAQGADAPKDKMDRNSQESHSKDSSQPNSLTSSSISTDSKPSENKEEKVEDLRDEDRKSADKEPSAQENSGPPQESISDA